MFCISISKMNAPRVLSELKKAEIAEIRLDILEFNKEEFKSFFNQNCETIATCRIGKYNDLERLEILKNAIDFGATYVDIEIESEENYRTQLTQYAKEKGCKVIISYHNYDCTPAYKELESIVEQCIKFEADIPKIASQVLESIDSLNLLKLYSFYQNIVVLGMGKKGMITRIYALDFGAPFTFCAPDGGEITASGQLEYSKLKQIHNLINIK